MMGSMRPRIILPLGLAVTLLASSPAAAGCFPSSIRGVTVSTHRSGQEWGSDSMRPTMEQLRELGADWIAIHPYAGVRGDGTIRIYRGLDPKSPPEEIVRPIREAHALGLKILIKPHLAYWGSPFAWRGDIGFAEDEAAWERFWTGYKDWIVKLAQIGREADGFVVGTELALTLGHEDRWVDLIGAVREVSDAPLTYAANWDKYESVPFWNELDAIGVQAYFPLVDAETETTEATVRAGWAKWSERLAAFSKAQERPVLFTELGYNHSPNTAREPWAGGPGDGEEAVQALCTRVALETIEREETIVGTFLWKWFPEPHPAGRDFRLATPTMRGVIRDAWSKESKR